MILSQKNKLLKLDENSAVAAEIVFELHTKRNIWCDKTVLPQVDILKTVLQAQIYVSEKYFWV